MNRAMSDQLSQIAKELPSARQRLLEAAFSEIHKHGFQGMRVDAILEKTDLTKGAFYHHFSSKQALGIAVVDELIHGKITDIWLDTLNKSNDPISAIQDAFEKSAECYGMDILMLGCPLNNLAQEMSPINEEFRLHINKIFHHWHVALVGVLQRGIQTGNIVGDIDPQSVATFILACVEGSIGLAKNERDLAPIIRTTDEIDRYLGTLRPCSPPSNCNEHT